MDNDNQYNYYAKKKLITSITTAKAKATEAKRV